MLDEQEIAGLSRKILKTVEVHNLKKKNKLKLEEIEVGVKAELLIVFPFYRRRHHCLMRLLPQHLAFIIRTGKQRIK